MKNFIYQYGASIMSGILSFIIQLLIINKLSIDTYGLYNYGLSFMILISVLSNLGLDGVFKMMAPEIMKKKRAIKLLSNDFIVIKLIVTFFLSVLIFPLFFNEFNSSKTSIIFILLLFVMVANQFILDTIYQTTYRQKEIFFIRLFLGLSKCMLLFLITVSKYDLYLLILVFFLCEAVVFLYNIIVQFPIYTTRQRLIEINKNKKYAKNFNYKAVLDIFLTPAIGIWFFKFAGASNEIIGYFAFITNIVIISTDRFSILNRLESFAVNFYLREIKHSKLKVLKVYESWKKLGYIFLFMVFVLLINYLNLMNQYLFDEKYKNIIVPIIGFFLIKSFSQLNYFVTAKIIYEKKIHIFSFSSLYGVVVTLISLIFFYVVDLINIESVLISISLGLFIKTLSLLIKSKIYEELKLFNLKSFFKLFVSVLITSIFSIFLNYISNYVILNITFSIIVFVSCIKYLNYIKKKHVNDIFLMGKL